MLVCRIACCVQVHTALYTSIYFILVENVLLFQTNAVQVTNEYTMRVKTTRRITIECHSSPKNARVLVKGPPTSFDHRKGDLIPRSIEIISQRYPQLLDLAKAGTLIAIPRPAEYTERRTDGYQEPKLVLLVGTAHISETSANEVYRVITTVQPDNVVVELCKSRYAQLYTEDYHPSASSTTDHDANRNQDISRNTQQNKNNKKSINALSISGNNLLEAYQRSIALGGQTALVLRLILSQLSERLSKDVDVQPGVEFRAARCAAQAVGAQIVLGDRPIEITLQRAWESLNWQSRWQFLVDVIRDTLQVNSYKNLTVDDITTTINTLPATAGLLDFSATTRAKKKNIVDMIESMKNNDDTLDAFIASFSNKYPQLLGPLLHERDLYLAWSLKRSKAVNGTETVVGVVGKGHLRGVVYALTHDQGELRFRDLAGRRRGVAAASEGGCILGGGYGVKRLVVETMAVSVLVWLVSECRELLSRS